MYHFNLIQPGTVGNLYDPDGLHRQLALWNRKRLAPGEPTAAWAADLREEGHMRWLEGVWIEEIRQAVSARAAEAPRTVQGFIDWFIGLKQSGPGQNDPLFDWLAEAANLEELKWFLSQEAAGEAGFDDLVALTQIKLPTQAKLELARNYWDEMGRGNEGGMHGPMLDRMSSALELQPTIEDTVWESLALANTLTALATTRRYAWHAVGALGVVELTAPSRVSKVALGMKRLELPPAARKYFELHAALDIKHADDWIANCLKPLMEEDSSRGQGLAEGALMRLTCGANCFDAYRTALWSSAMTH